MINKIAVLTKIYNTLCLINTKGEDTKLMGKCLEAFEEVLIELSKEKENNKEE